MMISASENGIRHYTKTLNNFGNTDEIEYSAKYDGMDYKISPESPLDTVALKRIDANTVERTGKLAGKVVETVVMKVSRDGKTLTGFGSLSRCVKPVCQPRVSTPLTPVQRF